jgi:probable HAF family extracellular repeat protein
LALLDPTNLASSGTAFGVNDSGTVIVGQSLSQSHDTHAVSWTNNTVHDLGTLPGGIQSMAAAVSGDGSTAVGSSDGSFGFFPHATSWKLDTNGNAISINDLGVLASVGSTGASTSLATAVNHDGSVIVGSNVAGRPVPQPGLSSAFRWTSIDQMQPVQGLLTAQGVTMTGWLLTAATGVSGDGKIIVGQGTFNGTDSAWIARVALPPNNGGGGGNGGGGNGGGGNGGLPSGLITMGVIGESLAGQAVIGQLGNSVVGGDLATFNQYATNAYDTHGQRNTPYNVFGYATYNSDPVGAGTVGITRDLPDSMIIGAAVSADYATNKLVFDGKATMQGGSGGVFVARVPDAGLQWFLGVDGTELYGDVTRGYLNGSGPASSHGNTDVSGYGATARIGWTFKDVIAKTQITPFASYTFTSAHVDGYTESGGPFPAVMDGFYSNQQTSRVGADVRYTFAPGQWVWGSAAWGHLIDNKGPTISGQLIGLFGVSAPGFTGAPDWAELTAGVRLPAWNSGAITASVTASVPTDNEPVTYVARLGVSQAF